MSTQSWHSKGTLSVVCCVLQQPVYVRLCELLLFVVLVIPGPVWFWSFVTIAVLVHVHPAASAYPKDYFLSAERSSDPWYHECIPFPVVPLLRAAYSVSRRHLFLAACLIRAHVTSCICITPQKFICSPHPVSCIRGMQSTSTEVERAPYNSSGYGRSSESSSSSCSTVPLQFARLSFASSTCNRQQVTSTSKSSGAHRQALFAIVPF